MIYKSITGIALTAMMFIGGCNIGQKVETDRGILGGVVSSVTDNIATAESGWGAFAFVGALMVLIGGIMAWLFKSLGPGLGMMATGMFVGGSALFLQEVFEQFGWLVILGSLGFIIWWLSDESRRQKLRKRAAVLFAQGRTSEAIEVEREADPALDKELKRNERKERKNV